MRLGKVLLTIELSRMDSSVLLIGNYAVGVHIMYLDSGFFQIRGYHVGFYRNRGYDGTVNLNRHKTTITSPTGLFCCTVPNAQGKNQMLCANIGM